MAIDLSEEEFEDLVDVALEQIPPELLALVENCLLLVEDLPPDGRLSLFGLYVGVPLTERAPSYPQLHPDRIYIYRRPIQALCSTKEQAAHEIAVTVVHEIGHYFGISESRLHELGWG